MRSLDDKLQAGRPGTRMSFPEPDPFDVEGADIGDGAILNGELMPEPSGYLSAEQRDGKPFVADLVYRETWDLMDARGCTAFVAKRLIEAYAQAFARYVQCEEAISKFGLLGKHPTTGAAIASPFAPLAAIPNLVATKTWSRRFRRVFPRKVSPKPGFLP